MRQNRNATHWPTHKWKSRRGRSNRAGASPQEKGRRSSPAMEVATTRQPFRCAEQGCVYLGLWTEATGYRCPKHAH